MPEQGQVVAGRQKAKDLKTELTMRKEDGTIQNKNSYGNDPNPPKDTKP